MPNPNFPPVRVGEDITPELWNRIRAQLAGTTGNTRPSYRTQAQPVRFIARVVGGGICCDFSIPPSNCAPSIVEQCTGAGAGQFFAFADARYTVQEVQFLGDDDSLPGPIDTSFDTYRPQEPGDTGGVRAGEFGFVVAINIQEVGLQPSTHTLPLGKAVIVEELTDSDGRQHYIFDPGGGGGSGIEECSIAGVVQSCNSGCTDAEQAAFDLVGPHLKCFALDSEGNYPGWAEDPQVYLPVNPNWDHGTAEFAGVNWNIFDPNAPIFTVFQGDRGWTMIFLEGLKLVDPPLPEELCKPFEGGDDEVGVCCFGTTCNTNMANAAECAGEGGVWHAGVASCSPNPCGGTLGACCQSTDPGCAACTVGTQLACNDLGGTFQGPLTTCNPSPCVAFGACCCNQFSSYIGCAEPGICFIRDECDCGNTGDDFKGEGTICTGGICN